MATARVLLIGNSDGIGLEATKQLLSRGLAVTGISRRASPLSHPAYDHTIGDVTSPAYEQQLQRLVDTRGPFDACVYCAGIGALFHEEGVAADARVFEVNLLGAVRTAQVLLPTMIRAGAGHLIVLSSQDDQIASRHAPSYAASKAAVTCYFEGLGMAVRAQGVYVTNVRFGFVDTKMARSPIKPFLMSAPRAAQIVLRALDTKPLRVTCPWRMAWLLRVLRGLTVWRIWTS